MRRIIILGGCQRSGTTLVRNLIGGNPSVGAVDTERGLIFNQYSRLSELTGLPEPTTRTEMGPAIERMVADEYIAKWGLNASLVLDSSGEFQPGWEGIFLSFVEAFGSDHDVPVVLLKRPHAELQFPYFQALSERLGVDVRFVYTVRNPLEVYRSWKYWGYRDGRNIAKSNPTKWCGQWLQSTVHLLEFNYRFPDSVKVVRYEDAVDEPSRISEELCRHLKLPAATQEMIGFDRTDVVNSSFRNSDTPASGAGTAKAGAETKPGLDPWERDVIRVACADRASLFGYELGAKETLEPDNLIRARVSVGQVPTRELMSAAGHELALRAKVRALGGTAEPVRVAGATGHIGEVHK